MKVGMTMLMAAMLTMACNAQTQDKPVDLKSKKDSASYALGVNIGSSFQQQGLDIEPSILAAGLADAMAGEAKLTDEQVGMVLQAMQQEVQQRQQEETARQGEENAKKSKEFLAKNKSAEGVMTTPSGLQYKVITPGSGAKPTAASTVRVHYTGTLIDGKKFDSSVDRGQPAEFPLANVIPGWTEGLQLMPVGAKYMFYIPTELAYGAQAPPSIGPNQTLIFEVELLEILK